MTCSSFAQLWPCCHILYPGNARRKATLKQSQPPSPFCIPGVMGQGYPCPQHSVCVKAKGNKGRTISLHPQERLLQGARALQRSEAFEKHCQMRRAVEHRLARLVQLGIRQTKFYGRKKTLSQLLMAAIVANLTLVARKTGHMASRKSQGSPAFAFFRSVWRHLASPVRYLRHLERFHQKAGFRLGLQESLQSRPEAMGTACPPRAWLYRLLISGRNTLRPVCSLAVTGSDQSPSLSNTWNVMMWVPTVSAVSGRVNMSVAASSPSRLDVQ